MSPFKNGVPLVFGMSSQLFAIGAWYAVLGAVTGVVVTAVGVVVVNGTAGKVCAAGTVLSFHAKIGAKLVPVTVPTEARSTWCWVMGAIAVPPVIGQWAAELAHVRHSWNGPLKVSENKHAFESKFAWKRAWPCYTMLYHAIPCYTHLCSIQSYSVPIPSSLGVSSRNSKKIWMNLSKQHGMVLFRQPQNWQSENSFTCYTSRREARKGRSRWNTVKKQLWHGTLYWPVKTVAVLAGITPQLTMWCNSAGLVSRVVGKGTPST